MMQGTYTAALGLRSHQQRIDSIAHNLSNVNTNGYKAIRLDFKDAIYSTMTRVEQPQTDLNMEKGHGVLVGATRRIHTQGLFQQTDVDTNLLLEGEGFFRVQAPSGEIFLTRDGSFVRSVEGDNVYLVNANGYHVLDTNGQRIAIRGNNQTELTIRQDGTFSENGSADTYATISVVTVPNEEGLTNVAGNLFSVSEASGPIEAVQLGSTGTQVIQQAVEGSNVNLGDEFSRLVRASRAMQLSSRALTMADEMDGTANTIRR